MRVWSFSLALAALVSFYLASWERQYLPVETLFASAVSQKDDDWQYIGTSKEDVKLFYSPERTVENRGLVQAWFKGVHPDSDKKVSYTVSLHEFDCRKRTYRLLQGTRYFRDGSARTSNQPSSWEHPLPNSLAEMEFRQICRQKLP
jgi:hypothetical protein